MKIKKSSLARIPAIVSCSSDKENIGLGLCMELGSGLCMELGLGLNWD